MKLPTVSVIMTTYNHAGFVKQAMESVLAQKEVDFEFLIADDGSTDRTREIVSSIKDERIQFFPNMNNRGACVVINELIEHALGEFIALINPDDYWIDQDKLAYQVQVMREKPSVGACFGRARLVDKDGLDIDKELLSLASVVDQENCSQGQWLRRFFDLGHCIYYPATLIRKSCYVELGGYNNRLKQLADFDMWIRFVKHYEIFISDRELISLRFIPSENTSRETRASWIKTINEHFLIAESFFENVTREQLIESFSDLLEIKDIPSEQHLDIEKVRLLFVENQYLGAAYKIVGLLKMYELLHSPIHQDLMISQYGIDDTWFQQQMSEVDVWIQTKVERDGPIAGLVQAGGDREAYIGNLKRVLIEHEEQIGGHIQASEIRGSSRWRLTSPIKFVGSQLLRIKIVLRASPYALSTCGGYRGLVKHAWRTYKSEGINGIKRRILFSASPGAASPVIDYAQPKHNDYSEWVRRYDLLTDQDRKKIKTQIRQLHKPPLISVVMPVYNPPLNMLEDAIRSVQGQLYPNWELCIADDASTDVEVHKLLQRYMDNDSRIKVVFREKNGHISAASNSALDLVNGEYVALLDNDDLLCEHALFWVADAIVTNPDAGLIYSDEDKIDQAGLRYDPYFKPDWNPDLFLSHNMICHLGAYRTDLVKKLGGFREGYEGAQDYDLALRCSEQLAPLQIVHIPRVLYHWRSHPGSTALAGNEKNYALLAGEHALNDHFARTQISAKIELLDFGMYRARYAIPESAPLVSLIIPTRNGLSLVKQCVESLFAKTTYKNFEVLIVDNNSDDPKALDYFASLAKDNRIRVLRDERSFNYSALNNMAVQQARGEYIGLINNDIEVISPEWLDEMIGLAIQPGIGAVGARLWYPNDTLQHGGCITGVGGVAGHSHKHLPRGCFGYFARAQLIQTLSVVTAACLVVKKSIFQEVGGLDEVNLKVAFNDVDFCLRVREAGYRNVWTPYAELYHHESATRGYEDTPEKQLRFRNEVLYMQKRWGNLLRNDPAYSPNLSLDHEDFSYAWPPRIPRI
ncbi:glycosyltransferase [Methylobacter tundripaludum]|uniref:Glycosyl transferase family 2 n=1 Tax=Methylobacter tundripaludum (strain ATCC BAA-1195 / DSM 17260 / SV96) TaxID=697282 RepID=G3IVU1_METTV|nr:glycosyltransferase [Methylobacter tundripaludum]EGW22948.1 glycosyl transferase family 2 [Methylobacter tundripaludum SV96]